jgi:hypothetical protein
MMKVIIDMKGYRKLISLDYIMQMTRKMKEHMQLNKNSNNCIVVLSSSQDLSNLKLVGNSLQTIIL